MSTQCLKYSFQIIVDMYFFYTDNAPELDKLLQINEQERAGDTTWTGKNGRGRE